MTLFVVLAAIALVLVAGYLFARKKPEPLYMPFDEYISNGNRSGGTEVEAFQVLELTTESAPEAAVAELTPVTPKRVRKPKATTTASVTASTTTTKTVTKRTRKPKAAQ